MIGNRVDPSLEVSQSLATDVLEKADRDQLLRIAKTFVRVEEIIDSVYDLNRLLEQVMSESEFAVDAETSSLLLYDSDSNDLFFEVALGPKGDKVKEIRLPLDETSIAGYSALHRIPVNIGDVSKDPHWNKNVDEKTQFQTKSLLAVPMLRQERLIGIIEVLNKKDGEAFNEEDIQILLVLASLAAIAIENARLYQKNLQAERLAVLGVAVANISHYIKNVLTGLKGSIALIEAAVQDEQYEILGRATQVLRRSYGRIEHLVKDMLSYSKGKDIEKVATCPNRILGDIHELMKESATTKGITLVLNLQSPMPVLYLDAGVLEDVMLNLVTNAVDAVYERHQRDKEFKGRVELISELQGDRLHLAVKDNGVGIEKDALHKIWTAFYTTKGSTGTGLGLAVSKKLIEDCDGTLTVESEPGVGTTFDVHLPTEKAVPATI
jgi:signal transduction histidine kinase